MTLMWEAEGAPGRVDELVAHVVEHAPGGAQIYRSSDDRVVVIDPTGLGVSGVPPELMSRPPHAWVFEQVARG